MLPFSLSAVTEFQYYNYVFDGIIVFFTLIYLIAGFRRGMLRTIWYFIFDLITFAAIFCIVKFACPLFIDKIPVVLVGTIKNVGVSFMLTTLYRFLLKVIVIILSYLIIRLGIFKAILKAMKEHDYTYSKKKNFFGRIVASLLTAGVAFTVSSGVIVSTKKMTGYTLFRNYESEMSETYVAKYGDQYIVNLVRGMIKTESIDNPHNTLVKSVTNGEHDFFEVLYYRDALYRLAVVQVPEYYFDIINADSNDGLVRFSEDLHVWAILAEVEDNTALLDTVVSPLLDMAIEEGYRYTGNVDELAPVSDFENLFSDDVYSKIEKVFY